MFPLLSPTLPSTSMHASTPLPSPPLGCPTLFYPPFPYSHHPSSPLHYHRIPPLNSYPTLSYTLPFPRTPSLSLSYHTPSLLYHTLSSAYPPLPYPHLGNCPPLPSLLFPQLPSPTLSYPLIWSTPFPHLPSPRISSPSHPPLPYPTTLLSPPLRSPLPPFTPLS